MESSTLSPPPESSAEQPAVAPAPATTEVPAQTGDVQISLDDVAGPDEVTFDVWSPTSLEDVRLEALPQAARPWVEKVVALSGAAEAKIREAVEKERAALQASIKAWDDLTTSISGADDKEAAAMAALKAERERVASTQAEYEAMRVANANLTWQAFELTHPEWHTLPPETQQVFEGLIERGIDLFEGSNDIERLDNALKFAMFKTGAGTAKPKAQVADEDPEAAGAAVLASGGRAPVAERPDIKMMSIDDVLNQFDSLL